MDAVLFLHFLSGDWVRQKSMAFGFKSSLLLQLVGHGKALRRGTYQFTSPEVQEAARYRVL